MPLNISPQLKAHLAQSTTTLATCIDIVLVDGSGVAYYFTDHDKIIQHAGNDYLPTSGYIAGASNTKIDLAVDNSEIMGIIDDDTLKYEDLLAGRFDFADVKIFQINYADTTMGIMTMISGKAGRVTLEENTFKVELRGLTQHFQQSIGEPYIVLCPADLGDSRCTVDLAPFTTIFTVSGVVVDAEKRIFTTDLTEADDYYDLGLVTWTTSNNQYFKMDVKKYLNLNGQIELYEPMPFDIQPGDQGTVQTGCDKKWETCRDRYSNQLNYRGFPHLYGLSEALRGKK